MKSVLLSIAMLVCAFACGTDDEHMAHEPHSTHEHAGDMSISASMVPEVPTQAGPNTMTIWVDAGEVSVINATVTIEVTMPGHGGHGTDGEPTVRELGEGAYEVTGLVFSMPGTWHVAVTVVDSEGKVSTNVFSYSVI